VKSCGLTEALETLGKTETWQRRARVPEAGRGVGLRGRSFLGAAAARTNSCAAILRLCEDGTVTT